jgi:hypothetical protein
VAPASGGEEIAKLANLSMGNEITCVLRPAPQVGGGYSGHICLIDRKENRRK